MNSFTRFAIFTVILALFLSRLIGAASAQGVPAPATYSVSPVVPPPSNETFTYPVLQINNSGQILWVGQGSYRLDSGTWTSVADSQSSAAAMNNAGDIVGQFLFSSHGNDYGHAFLYSGGLRRDLETYSNGLDSFASAVNDNDEVTAYSETNGFGGWTVVYWKDGVFVPVSPLPDPPYNVGVVGGAVYINNVGQVAASSYSADGRSHAFIWTKDGKTKDLGVPPAPCNDSATPQAINVRGEVVGYGHNIATAQEHAFLYDGAAMLDIGTLGGDFSRATAINSSGQVVGFSTTATGSGAAFLYQNGIMYDLNSLLPLNSGWVLTEAISINDRGQIVGDGTYKGQPGVFLLTPIVFSVTSAKLTVPALVQLPDAKYLLTAYLQGIGRGSVHGRWLLDNQVYSTEDIPEVNLSAGTWAPSATVLVPRNLLLGKHSFRFVVDVPTQLSSGSVDIDITGFDPATYGFSWINGHDPVGRLFDGICLGMSHTAWSNYMRGIPTSNVPPSLFRLTYLSVVADHFNHLPWAMFVDVPRALTGYDPAATGNDSEIATEAAHIRQQLQNGVPQIMLCVVSISLNPLDTHGGHAIVAIGALYCNDAYVADAPNLTVNVTRFDVYDPNQPGQIRNANIMETNGIFSMSFVPYGYNVTTHYPIKFTEP